jgi:hypothetical protein
MRSAATRSGFALGRRRTAATPRSRSRRLTLILAPALALAATAGLISAAPAQAFYLGYFTSTPAMAWTGSSLVLTAVDSDTNELDYWWQAAGTSTWTEEPVAPGITGTPAIAWTGSSVVITAVGVNGDLYYWWQAAGSTTWNQQTVSTAANFTDSAYTTRPSIAWTGGSVIITATSAPVPASESADTTLYYFWQAAGSGTWNPEIVPSQYGTVAQIAWTGSTAEIIDSAEDGSGLNYFWQPAGSPSWQGYNDYDPSLDPLYAAIAPDGTTAIIAFSGLAGFDSSGNEIDNLYFGSQPTVSSWTTEEADPSTRLGDYGNGTPAITTADGTPVIAAAGYNGDLYYWQRETRSQHTFARQTVATATGMTNYYAAPAMIYNGTAIVIAGATSTGYLYTWTQDNGTWNQQFVA